MVFPGQPGRIDSFSSEIRGKSRYSWEVFCIELAESWPQKAQRAQNADKSCQRETARPPGRSSLRHYDDFSGHQLATPFRLSGNVIIRSSAGARECRPRLWRGRQWAGRMMVVAGGMVATIEWSPSREVSSCPKVSPGPGGIAPGRRERRRQARALFLRPATLRRHTANSSTTDPIRP